MQNRQHFRYKNRPLWCAADIAEAFYVFCKLFIILFILFFQNERINNYFQLIVFFQVFCKKLKKLLRYKKKLCQHFKKMGLPPLGFRNIHSYGVI